MIHGNDNEEDIVKEEITDEALWDFADELLDAWNIEDTNPPSLTEQFRDRFTARFGSKPTTRLGDIPTAFRASKAEAWDECLDAIEQHELNTEQARAGNPYRSLVGQTGVE